MSQDKPASNKLAEAQVAPKAPAAATSTPAGSTPAPAASPPTPQNKASPPPAPSAAGPPAAATSPPTTTPVPGTTPTVAPVKAPPAPASLAVATPAPAPETPEEIPASGKFINVLVIGVDANFAKLVQTSLSTLQAQHPDINYRVFPGNAKEKLIEYLDKYQFHSIIFEEEMADVTLDAWLKGFSEILKKSKNNKTTPVILATSKTDLNKTKGCIKAGYKDVIVKPLDQSLFLEKMNLYNKDIKLIESNLLFSMDAAKDVDVGFYFKTKSVSEYGMKVTSEKAVDVGSVVTIYATFIEEPLAAVVIEAVKGGDEQFTLSLMYVGVTPAQTQTIRKFFRTQYAEGKEAA